MEIFYQRKCIKKEMIKKIFEKLIIDEENNEVEEEVND